jgi:hypothetical protein
MSALKKYSFHELTQEIHSLLRAERLPEEVAKTLEVDVNRLAIYSGFIKGHIVRMIDRSFNALKCLFDEKAWDILMDMYFKKYPAGDWRYYRCAEQFPDFIQSLKSSPDFGIQDFHVELAQFEWTELMVYNSEIILPKIGEIRSRELNPTLAVLTFRYPVADFVISHRSEKLSKNEERWMQEKKYLEMLPAPKTVFFFRNPKTQYAVFVEATDRLLFAFKVIYDGISEKEAAKTTGQSLSVVQSVLKEASQIGLILQPKNS